MIQDYQVCGGYFDLDSKNNRIKELETELTKPDFWDDQTSSSLIIQELNELKSMVKDVSTLSSNVQGLVEMINGNIDSETQELLEEELLSNKKQLEKLKLFTLLDGEYDKNNCIFEIHSGAGGTEACDWAMMIYRMYLRFCDSKGYKYDILDYQEGDEVGIKSVSILIKGLYSYGYLKCEKGIHRLVRLSPFDANHKRHTSFASVLVTPEINDSSDIKIDEKDLKIDVYRSSGNGGQGVNTTDSAVRITHLPTKIVVTCQNERSQLQNKEHAMNILKNKLKLLEIEKKENELNAIKGEQLNIEFGSQIRSYVMHPYSMVKDHRTKYETSDVLGVLDGKIEEFIESELKRSKHEE